MDYKLIDSLVEDRDDVYKKGQLTLWMLLAISDSKKYAAQITDFMKNATGGNFEVKEQSLYRALRRFDAMGLVKITKEQSPNSGPKRKYYELTAQGEVVLGRFIKLHIAPLFEPHVSTLLIKAQSKGQLSE
jgi:DNA-binding PadR family transcriptional regulator